MSPDEVVGAQFRVYRTGGYVRCDHSEGAELTGQDAREELQAIAALAPGPTTLILVDLRGIHSVTREARRVFARSDVPSRIAMFMESPLSRVIANFFIGVGRPGVPTKLFTDVEAAQRWLLDDE